MTAHTLPAIDFAFFIFSLCLVLYRYHVPTVSIVNGTVVATKIQNCGLARKEPSSLLKSNRFIPRNVWIFGSESVEHVYVYIVRLQP